MADALDILTPSQAIDLLDWVIRETRGMLAKALEEDFKAQNGEIVLPEEQKEYSVSSFIKLDTGDPEKSTFKGFCGHAQTFIRSTLEDIHYTPKCYTIQSIQQAAWCHVGLTIELETTEGIKTYLLDPTFKQFCTGWEKSPGAILEGLPDGERMVKDLVDKGFVELTPTLAASYLSAFCRGTCPFTAEKDVMDYFSNPSDSRSIQPVEKLWPPKGFFAEKGWVAAPRS